MKIDKETEALLDSLNAIDLDKDTAFIIDSIKAGFVEDVSQSMKAKGINKSELARRLGKSKQYVSRVLNETANFTLSSIVEISNALGCTIELKIKDNAGDYIQNDLVEQCKQHVPDVEKADISPLCESTGIEMQRRPNAVSSAEAYIENTAVPDFDEGISSLESVA